MKCKLIVDSRGPNLFYNKNEAVEAKRLGEIYAHSPEVDVPAGTLIEHPQAWIHTLPGNLNRPASAVPADDACREMYLAKMRERPAKIATLDRILDAKVMSESHELNNRMLRLAYCDELNELDATKYPIPSVADHAKLAADVEAYRQASGISKPPELVSSDRPDAD